MGNPATYSHLTKANGQASYLQSSAAPSGQLSTALPTQHYVIHGRLSALSGWVSTTIIQFN